MNVMTLWDAGAERNSYINSIFLDKHRDALSPYIQPIDSHVTLADGATTKPVRETVTLNISTLGPDPDGITHEGKVTFLVFNMGTNIDLCVGLPDKEDQFIIPVVKWLIEGSRKKLYLSSNPDSSIDPNSVINRLWTEEELMYP